MELASYHASRGDYERAARILGRLPPAVSDHPDCREARSELLRDGMRRLAGIVAEGLFSRKGTQAVQRLPRPHSHLVTLHDVLCEELLEVREVELEWQIADEQLAVEVRRLRTSLPDWRLAHFLERETAATRPDVKGFAVAMEPGRLTVRCEFHGIPLTLFVRLDLISADSLAVRFDPSPRVLRVFPIPRGELVRALEGLAAGAPAGLVGDVSADGFTLNFPALFGDAKARVNLCAVEVVAGEVRARSESTAAMTSREFPSPVALLAGDEPTSARSGRAGPGLEALASTVPALPPAAPDPLAGRCLAAPLEKSAYRELARRFHASGRPAAARLVFEAVWLLDPADREAAEYLRAPPSRAAAALPPPAAPRDVEMLRNPGELRPPAGPALRCLARELGWLAGPQLPAGASLAIRDLHAPLLELRDAAARALGVDPPPLHVAPDGPPLAGPAFLCLPASHLQGREPGEALFLAGRALGRPLLEHGTLACRGRDDLGVLAGIVYQIGAGQFNGGSRFRPIRSLDAWLPESVAGGLVAACAEFAGRVDLELLLWLEALEMSADRAGLLACGSLRAAVRALLGAAGGPVEGLGVARLIALAPDPGLGRRIAALLSFAALDAHRGAV